MADPAASAHDYGEQDVHVFPVSPNNKRPLIDAWNTKATSDRQQIEAWWQRWPQAMIGMPTGMQSGVLALDVDIKNGHDGFASLDRLGNIPATATRSRTPSGGAHYLFKMPNFHVGNSASQLGDGLDGADDLPSNLLPPCRYGRVSEDGAGLQVADRDTAARPSRQDDSILGHTR